LKIGKLLFIFLITQCSLKQLYGQVHEGRIDSMLLPVTGPHYQPEYTFDTSVNPAAWLNQKAGLHAAFGSTDTKYFRTEVPAIENEKAIWEATGWKGERISTQIVVWSPDTLQQVRFKINNLVNEKGADLDKSNIQLNMVRYVLANYPYGSSDAVCSETPYKDGYLMPDRFEAFENFDVPGKTVRPVWVSCNIPAGTQPGVYSGTIETTSTSGNVVLHIHIKVQNMLLPPPHEWKYRLDLWQNPWVIADYYHVQPWGAEHKALLKKHLQLYADAGGKYITTYGVHSPWGDNEYAIERGMIDWVKRKDGSWKFSYNIFDQYVELAMSVGIDKAITIYTPLPWGNRFRYTDEKTGNYIYETWPPESDMFKNVWNVFLNDLRAHLEKKGWLNKTYLGINENAMDQTLAAIKVIKDNNKTWKITYAGNWHKELDGLLDDYCFLYGNESTVEETKARALKGLTTTFYVCCNPAKPNNFVFSPPIEGRWISWYSAAHGYSGFLRWAYDSWPADPVRDARYGSWPAGDCYMVYPGGNSCIRFETLRQGIADYEKIRMIRELAARSADKKVKELITAFDEHLASLVTEKTFIEDKLKQDIEKGNRMIEELTDILGR